MPEFQRMTREEFESLPEDQPWKNYRLGKPKPPVKDQFVGREWPIPTPELAESAAAELGWIQEPPIPVGLKLAELMSERGILQKNCARMIGLWPQSYDKLEKARDGSLKTVHIRALARVLELTSQEELGLMHLSGCLTRMNSKIYLRERAA